MVDTPAEAFKKGRASGMAAARAKAKSAKPRKRPKGAPYRHPHKAVKRAIGGFQSKHPLIAAVVGIPAEIALIGGVIDGMTGTNPVRKTIMEPIVSKIPVVGQFLTDMSHQIDIAITDLRNR